MRRALFTPDHEEFRSLVRSYLARSVLPVYNEWESAGAVPRRLFRDLGELGVMGVNIPIAYGGAGCADYRYNVVLQEETGRANVVLGALRTHLDVVLPYFLTVANAEQQGRWLPGIATGEIYTAIAMTEPGAGSDLAGIRTTAVRRGDGYVLNGSKTFISGGEHADLVVVVARTSAPTPEDRRGGLSLFVVEAGSSGFVKGPRLAKLGLRTQDTTELFFDELHVPAANLLGEPGTAFRHLTGNLAQERIAIAVGSVAQARAALALTVDHTTGRTAFGTTVSAFQNTKFVLAGVSTEIEAAQAMLDLAVSELLEGRLSGADAARVKLFCTEMQARSLDSCLQLFGGYGYMLESPIARLYADARATRIYAGTSEIMRTIIAKSLGL